MLLRASCVLDKGKLSPGLPESEVFEGGSVGVSETGPCLVGCFVW